MKDTESKTDLGLREFQQIIESTYYQKDSTRGVDGSFMWLVEEVGELARTLNSGDPNSSEEQAEFADVLAWLTTIANVAEVDLSEAVMQKYGSGCPGCGEWVCRCSKDDKP